MQVNNKFEQHWIFELFFVDKWFIVDKTFLEIVKIAIKISSAAALNFDFIKWFFILHISSSSNQQSKPFDR